MTVITVTKIRIGHEISFRYKAVFQISVYFNLANT